MYCHTRILYQQGMNLNQISCLIDEHSYAHQYEDIHVAVVGRSFYEQYLTTESLHLGISTTAMHWLSSL